MVIFGLPATSTASFVGSLVNQDQRTFFDSVNRCLNRFVVLGDIQDCRGFRTRRPWWMPFESLSFAQAAPIEANETPAIATQQKSDDIEAPLVSMNKVCHISDIACDTLHLAPRLLMVMLGLLCAALTPH